MRLRISLPEAGAFGDVAAAVNSWASDLYRAGLLRKVRYPTSYPETGRWGSGAAMAAAERVFGADSRALLVQLGLLDRPERRALVAAYSVAIAAAFTGSPEAVLRWLVANVPAAAPSLIARSVFAEAVRIGDPHNDWAALRAAPGGAAIVAAWASQRLPVGY